MKKIIFISLIILTIIFGSVVTFAEEPVMTETKVVTEAVTEAVTEDVTEAITENESVADIEDTTDTEAVIDTEIVPSHSDNINYAEKFVDYIFSGAAGSTEIMDKIIAMGSQYLEAKEQGYTFSERINQLLTPDNIMATAAAVFLVVIGIAFFFFRHSQIVSSRLTMAEIARLRELYEKEVDSNSDLREHIKQQNAIIEGLNERVTWLSEKSDLTKSDMSHVNKLALATATMVKDVFMNSKTIDSSGKNLLLHDYTKALEESEKFGEVKNEDK